MRIKKKIKSLKFLYFICCPRTNFYHILLWVVLFGLWANLVFFFPNQQALLKYIPPFNPKLNVNENLQLGAEYDFIARALYGGRGFSDPFGGRTGPTAWMPPFYPLFLASLYFLVDGNSIGVVIIIILLTLGTWILIGLLCLRVLHHPEGPFKTCAFSLLYAVLLYYNFRWLFQITHDIWLIAGLFMVTIYFLRRILAEGFTTQNSVAWGIAGSVSPLISPNLGLVWIFFHLWIYLANKKAFRPYRKRWIALLAIFLVPTALWTIRNFIVFGQLIPIKSNLYFDAFQSNWISSSGIVTEDVFVDHPISPTARSHSAYRVLGEKKFLEEYRKAFFWNLALDKRVFVEKIFRRFLAVFFVYYPESPEKIMPMNFFMHPLIGGTLLLFLILRKKSSFQKAVVLSVFVFVLPYIFVAYYGRYYAYLIGPQSIILYWCGQRISGFFINIPRRFDRCNR